MLNVDLEDGKISERHLTVSDKSESQQTQTIYFIAKKKNLH